MSFYTYENVLSNLRAIGQAQPDKVADCVYAKTADGVSYDEAEKGFGIVPGCIVGLYLAVHTSIAPLELTRIGGNAIEACARAGMNLENTDPEGLLLLLIAQRLQDGSGPNETDFRKFAWGEAVEAAETILTVLSSIDAVPSHDSRFASGSWEAMQPYQTLAEQTTNAWQRSHTL